MDKGSRHLDSVIDSGTLSGAAYKAGQTMFQTYIFPMIKQLKSAINDIQNDLTSYKTADSQIKSVSNRIDEAHVKALLTNTNQLIALVEQKMRDDKDLIKSFTEKGLSGAITGLSELPGLEGQLDNLKSLKHDYEKQLEAIQTFSFSTNSLFTDSLEAFKYALQGVEIINQSKASVDGTITLPAGADMSWSSKLQGEKFRSQPTEKDKLLQKYANDPETLKQILGYTSEPLNMSVESAEALYLSVKNSDTSMKDFDDKLSQWDRHYSEDKYSKDKFGSFQTFVGTMLTTIGLFDGMDEIFGVGTIVDVEIEEALGTEIIAGGDLAAEDILISEQLDQIDLSTLKFSDTVLKHTGRPYQESKLLIGEIMEEGAPILDPQGGNALFWKVPGTFNGREGTFEVLIDPESNSVWHFLFKRSK
ncbi:hypothetical protein LKF67_0408 [Lactococcus lactis subsp. lactis]|nr:hypothetical protein LKF67_0408 [Lactococcus lactis subsp. lactis]